MYVYLASFSQSTDCFVLWSWRWEWYETYFVDWSMKTECTPSSWRFYSTFMIKERKRSLRLFTLIGLLVGGMKIGACANFRLKSFLTCDGNNDFSSVVSSRPCKSPLNSINHLVLGWAQKNSQPIQPTNPNSALFINKIIVCFFISFL